MGLKVAISGKGGVGKTTLSAALGEFLSLKGYKTILIDADPDSNLAAALGIQSEKRSEIKPLSLEKDLIKERVGVEPGEGGMFILNPRVDDLVEKYGLSVNPNLSLIVAGSIEKAGSGCFCPQSSLLRALLAHLILDRNEWVIVDMEAGLEHLGRSTAEGINYLVIVVEPGQRSLETALKIKNLAGDLGIKQIAAVANKVRSQDEEEKIKRFLEGNGLLFLETLPWEDKLTFLDLQDRPVKDLGKESDFFQAIRRTVQKLAGQSE